MNALKRFYFKSLSNIIGWYARKIGSKYYYGVHKQNTHEIDYELRVKPKVKAGDIIVVRTLGTHSQRAIPGFWTHLAVVISDTHVIEATTDNVKFTHISDVLTHTDDYAVLRLKGILPYQIIKLIEKAKSYIGRPYDFGMEIVDTLEQDPSDQEVFCSEIGYKAVNFAMGKVLHLHYVMGYPTFTPQDFYDSGVTETIIEKRNGKIITQ